MAFDSQYGLTLEEELLYGKLVSEEVMAYRKKHLKSDPVVYFIGPEVRNDDSLIKIGSTIHLKDRFKMLDISSPVTLKIYGVVKCCNHKEARSMEKKLHTRFNSYRVRGEWFKFTKELLEFINSIS